MDRRRLVLGAVVILAVIVLSIAGLLYVQRSRWLEGTVLPRTPLPVVPFPAGDRVDISSGRIGVNQFIDYLRDATGCEVLASPELLGQQIMVPTPMEDVEPEVVRALLETNGLRVDLDTLPGGRVVILVSATDD